MPTAEATLLAACARAHDAEREWLRTAGFTGKGYWVFRAGAEHDPAHLFEAETVEECITFIDQRALAAGLLALAESEPTAAMRRALTATVAQPGWGDSVLRAMLGALLEGADDANVA